MAAIDRKILKFMEDRGSDVNSLMLMRATGASRDEVLAVIVWGGTFRAR